MPDRAGLEQKAGLGARALTPLATLHQLQLKTQCLCELPHSSFILHHHYPSPWVQRGRRGSEPASLPACPIHKLALGQLDGPC